MALNKLITLNELSEEERFLNIAAAQTMVVNLTYRFTEPVQTIPLERRQRGARKYGEPFTFREAVYLCFQEKTEEHLFVFKTPRGKVFLLPMFLCGGVQCYPVGPQPAERPRHGLRLIESKSIN